MRNYKTFSFRLPAFLWVCILWWFRDGGVFDRTICERSVCLCIFTMDDNFACLSGGVDIARFRILFVQWRAHSVHKNTYWQCVRFPYAISHFFRSLIIFVAFLLCFHLWIFFFVQNSDQFGDYELSSSRLECKKLLFSNVPLHNGITFKVFMCMRVACAYVVHNW